MILDKQNLFSEDQAITVSAASTNVIDLGVDAAEVFVPNEKDVDLFCQVTEALETGTSVAVKIQTDSDVAFGSATDLYETAAIVTASLVAGYKFALPKLPRSGVERYIRLYFTIVGTFDAGTVSAGVVLDEQTNL